MDTENPLNESLQLLFTRLSFLHFSVHFLDGRVKEVLEGFERQADIPWGAGRRGPYHGTTLAITDLTGPTDNGWLLLGRAGSFNVEGSEYKSMLEWLRYREGALSIAQGYEAFETYLYDVTAALLSRSEDKLVEKVLKRSSLADGDMKAQVRAVYRQKDNSKLIAVLRKLGSDLNRAEAAETNNRFLSMTDWYVVVGKVRHAATHSKSEIRTAEINKLTSTQRTILEANFPGTVSQTGHALEIDKESSVFAIQLLAEYGHAIYKSLSIANNWDSIAIP